MAGRAVLFDDEDEIEQEEDDARVASNDADDDLEGRDVDDEDDDEDDEEEEGQDEYDKDDGFIADDIEEEEDGDEEQEESEGERRKKKKKKKRRRESERTYELDEDDYMLLQDNDITGIRRPPPVKKFKRLKKGRDDGGAERSGLSDEDESDMNSMGGRTAGEKLEDRLFGGREASPLEDIVEEEEQRDEREDVDNIPEYDDIDDFIVSDEDEFDENGEVVRRPKTMRKKKSRQASGIFSEALQEAHDIFGDPEDLIALREKHRQASQGDGMEKRLEDEVDPFILSEKYMTPKDDLIRETDIPERIQLSEDITGPPPTDDESIEEESSWIYNQLGAAFSSPLPGMNLLVREINKGEIGNVLSMMHMRKFDIPFIAMYRKELCASLLKDPEFDMPVGDEKTPKLRWHKVLWAIQTLDRKWLLLQKRKNALQLYYNKRFEEEARRIYDETRLALNRQLFESVIEALKVAKSEREVDDVDAKFNLHFPPGEVETDEGQFKRPKRKSLYSTCYKAGLWEVAKKFSINSEKFGLLLSLEEVVRRDDVEDAKETPEEVAANFTCQMFETPQDVLKGARHMAAVEIGCEPIVRKYVRAVFMENAVVSTSPTPEGNLAIDAFHQLSGVKWLCNKPISKFEGAQWLLIQKAEEEKLLKVTIKLPEAAQSKLLADANEYYLSECVSKSAQLWNEQRKMILEDSFFTYILPSMEKEARHMLTSGSKNWLLMEYGKQLWNKVSVAPYQRKEKDVDNNDGDAPGTRVLACCWGPGKPATTFVMLDSAGEMVDVLYAGSICVRSQAVAEQQRKSNDLQRLLKFITDHQPQVACVGAANMACKQLRDDIYEVIFKIVEDHPREVSQDQDMNVTIVDESLSRLYENSRVSSDQLPQHPGVVRRAVGLGRHLQNPLAMVATLCGPGKEILSWKLCPLEHFLTPDEKYEVVEQVMVDATNQIGLDINLAMNHEWLFASLQFVSGLGPRKASALQKAFVRARSISTRKDILMTKIIKKKVFINAAGFLRVRQSGVVGSSQYIDVLDDSRIHPESYEMAKSLANDVYAEYTAHEPSELDDDAQEMAIELVRERPDMLEALDIDEYSKSLFERFGNKRETLYDIKLELLHGFQERRIPYRDLKPEEEFSLLSGETDDTLSEGRTVQVTIRSIQEDRLTCYLDSGLRACIMADQFSEEGIDPDKMQLQEGDIITAKVRNIDKGRYLVYLTCNPNYYPRIRNEKKNIDPYYREEKILHSEQEKARKEKELAKKHFKPRMIVHPRFQNWTADEAMEFLSDKDAGDSIIRPSSKGPSHLTLTLKIYDGVYAHKDISEGGKDHKDITSLLRLGKTLTIDQETFEDLDEVMDRYVDPLVGHLKNMLSYRKFKRGSKAEVDDLLRTEKAENPLRIVYCFGISHEYPGTFILSYIRSSNPHHEYIGLYPKGFRFRKKDFEDIDRLVAYFQRNIDKPPPDAMKSTAQIAAGVPMKSPGRSNSDRERSSTPGSRTGSRDYRNNGGGRDAHPSGIPRPARGRGRGHGRGDGGQDSSFGSPKWSSGSKDDDGLSNFPGSKVQNSPGKEWFPGGGSGGAGGWGGGDGGWGGGGSWGKSVDAGSGGSGDVGGWGGDSWGSNASGGVGGRRGSGSDGWGSGGAGRGRRGGRDGGWGRSGWGSGNNGGGGWGGTNGGNSGSGWGGDSMALKDPSRPDSGFGAGNSWAGSPKKLVPPQPEGGKGWSGW